MSANVRLRSARQSSETTWVSISFSLLHQDGAHNVISSEGEAVQWGDTLIGAARKVKGSKAHRELALRWAINNLGIINIFVIVFGNIMSIMMIITRLARVKEEMGDKEGAEDLREEARES